MRRPVGHHHGDLRAALIDAALEMLEADETSLTMRALARHAGVSPAAPYHHFADRSALLAEIARRGFEQLRASQLLIGGPDPGRRLSATVAAYVRFGAEHRAHYRVMFSTDTGAHPFASNPAVREIAAETFRHLSDLVRDAGDDGVEPDRRAFLIWNLAHGAVDASRWSTDLDPDLDVATVAESVGRAALTIARANDAS